jgi:hypothetical protein
MARTAGCLPGTSGHATTDTLLKEINTSGIVVTEHSDGYHWEIPELGLSGRKTTAVAAIGSAIHQVLYELETAQRELARRRLLEEKSVCQPGFIASSGGVSAIGSGPCR